MARELKLFHDITLNSGRDTHYVFNYFNNYMAFLSRSFGERIIDYNNYRVNTGTIKVSLNYLTKNTLSKITYAIEYEVNDDFTYYSYYRCYLIKRYEIVSGYVVFYVEDDKWANNIEKANIFNLNVQRSNRLLGNGIFDEVKYTIGGHDIDYFDEKYNVEQGEHVLRTTRICIAFLLQYNISQQVFGNDKISRTQMFITESAYSVYQDLKTHVQSAFKYDSYLELLAQAIGTITEVQGNLGTLDAQVIKAWVVDSQKIDIDFGAWQINVKCNYGGYNTTLNVYHLGQIDYEEDYEIEDVTPNKVYYVGNYLNGFKLTPYCNKQNGKYKLSFTLHYIVDDNEIKIVASQGERVKDITNMFECYLNTNQAKETALRQFARSFGNAMGATNATFGGINKGAQMGGPVMAGVMGGLSFANSAFSLIPQQPSFENAIGGGDGMHTFYLSPMIDNDENIMAEYVANPYIITIYTSARDEEENAKTYGVNYYAFISGLHYLLDNNEFEKYGANYRDFLQCECEVANVQSDDANFIMNELKRGIFIEKIE